MKKNFNFTTAFAMKCDAEQFESVRKEMEGMGYQKMYDYDSGYLCTNYNRENYLFGLAPKNDYFQKLSLEAFNRDLCLALAAMTDKPDGIIGEWFKGTNGTFIQKKDDCDIASIATKATADELIKYFTEAKLEQKQPEFKGQLQGFPPEVVEKMLERQVEQGNKRNMRVFELAEYRDDAGGGFNWSKTVEGYTFWNHVIDKKDFDLFFKLYPKTNKTEPDPQIEALQKRIEDLEYNVKQLAESVQKVKESEPQPASRFADKQPIWAWDDDDTTFRRAGFWDAKNHYMFTCDGKRSGYLYDNYEPIPADQIPAWMIDAAKHLED